MAGAFKPDIPSPAAESDRATRLEGANVYSFVQPVEGSDLVGLGQRRAIEHSIAEVFDGAAHRQHGLPNVHNLSRAVADDVDS